MKIEIHVHEEQVYTFFVRDMAAILVGITRPRQTVLALSKQRAHSTFEIAVCWCNQKENVGNEDSNACYESSAFCPHSVFMCSLWFSQ
jgi:hypothetical protein